MSEAAIVINVGAIDHPHGNGLSGMFIVPAKPDNEPFSLLVVYPTPEIQDIGDQRKTIHWVKALPLARAIVGFGSDVTRERYGVLLCKAEPEVPRELLKALENESDFLADNPPEGKYIRKGNSMEWKDTSSSELNAKKIELSRRVVEERNKFQEHCRTLVTAQEVATANRNMLSEYGRLIADGDMMWARPTEQVNISDLHRLACRTMGQERPWSYTPKQMFDCPGCGQKIQENVITCGHCHAILDAPIAVLAKLPPEERARRLYPERYTEAPALTSSGNAQDRGHTNPRR